MKVLVAGATGVIGRRLVPMLIEAGHEVIGMTRSQAKADALEEAGATPLVCDVFNANLLHDRVKEAQPEVIVHEMTDLPPAIDPRKAEIQMAGTDRIRTEGTANLVAAALAAGTRRMVAQSIAFAYAPSGRGLRDEEDPLYESAPAPWGRSVRAVAELERLVTASDHLEGIVLRYGFFYGAGSSYASDGSIAAQVRARRFPIVGTGQGVFSFIHVDDAATATVAAVGRGWPGIYNLVDDDPAPLREWLPVYADALKAKKPRRVPKVIARFVAGRYAVLLATELQGASNERAKRELAWQPRYASWRQGFKDSLG
jgi:nucleoside-diphosphate-sugar epimerase